MIDWTRVEELISEIGVDDFGEVVELFLDEVDAAMDALDDARDPASRSQTLHLIKGCAWNLGFDELGKACATLEANGVSDGPQLAKNLRQVYDVSKTALKEGLEARAIAMPPA